MILYAQCKECNHWLSAHSEVELAGKMINHDEQCHGSVQQGTLRDIEQNLTEDRGSIGESN